MQLVGHYIVKSQNVQRLSDYRSQPHLGRMKPIFTPH